jgi:hypothetical protein
MMSTRALDIVRDFCRTDARQKRSGEGRIAAKKRGESNFLSILPQVRTKQICFVQSALRRHMTATSEQISLHSGSPDAKAPAIPRPAALLLLFPAKPQALQGLLRRGCGPLTTLKTGFSIS